MRRSPSVLLLFFALTQASREASLTHLKHRDLSASLTRYAEKTLRRHRPGLTYTTHKSLRIYRHSIPHEENDLKTILNSFSIHSLARTILSSHPPTSSLSHPSDSRLPERETTRIQGKAQSKIQIQGKAGAREEEKHFAKEFGRTPNRPTGTNTTGLGQRRISTPQRSADQI